MADKVRMPSKDQALPGRSDKMPVAAKHVVLKTPMEEPFGSGTGETRLAMFGMGCFWGAERKFWQSPGRGLHAGGLSAGGYTPNPTYREVCTGDDRPQRGRPRRVRSVEGELRQSSSRCSGENHDPTQGMRARATISAPSTALGSTRSTPKRRRQPKPRARRTRDKLRQAGYGGITTEIVDAPPFYHARDYHQQYLEEEPPTVTAASAAPASPVRWACRPARMRTALALRGAPIHGRADHGSACGAAPFGRVADPSSSARPHPNTPAHVILPLVQRLLRPLLDSLTKDGETKMTPNRLLVSLTLGCIIACGGSGGDDTASQDGHLESAGTAPKNRLGRSLRRGVPHVLQRGGQRHLGVAAHVLDQRAEEQPEAPAVVRRPRPQGDVRRRVPFEEGDVQERRLHVICHLALGDDGSLDVKHDGTCSLDEAVARRRDRPVAVQEDRRLLGRAVSRPRGEGPLRLGAWLPFMAARSPASAPSGTSDWGRPLRRGVDPIRDRGERKVGEPVPSSPSARCATTKTTSRPSTPRTSRASSRTTRTRRSSTRLPDCTITLVKDGTSLAISHDDSCMSLGLSDEVSVDSPALHRETDQCWDDTKHDLAAIGTCPDF